MPRESGLTLVLLIDAVCISGGFDQKFALMALATGMVLSITGTVSAQYYDPIGNDVVSCDQRRSKHPPGRAAAAVQQRVLIAWHWIEWNSINSDAALRFFSSKS